MNIKIYYRYFWPDTPPYAKMLNDISLWLSEDGHHVTIKTAQPSYKPEAKIPLQPKHEISGRRTIRRFWLFPERSRGIIRVINAALFVVRSVLDVLFGLRVDVVWTATMPPVLQAFLLMVAAKCRGSKFLYHMQDIYPEIVSPNAPRGKWHLALLQSLDNVTLRHADAVVVLSKDMKRTIENRVGSAANIHIINNYALEQRTKDSLEKAQAQKDTKLLFAGNIGKHQNLEKLLEAFMGLNATSASLTFIGEGSVKPILMKKVGEHAAKNVFFEPHMPVNDAFEKMCQSDIGIASLNPGLYRCAFPSKILTYFAAHLPVFAVVESESAISSLLIDNNLGMTSSPKASVEELRADLADMIARAKSTSRFATPTIDLFSPEARRLDWLKLLNSLTGPTPST
jgi:colanic acid biosynthesis glycosyl transferase WcaI